ncbi:hypothetical protein [uncultured Sneathiella sp.]|jgi:hypothetical protein|uniref:hypothetical protein n=1 Tax=uncultured Sneathiella sp. TaxID=879315 RepID=UPI0030EBBBD0|tara:strand:- start:64239 stop:64976 length:738 start_codon:yes stop_codon:yes gene_type:complete
MNFSRQAGPYLVDGNGQDFVFAQAQGLKDLLSAPRMAVYIREAKGDPELAFCLYRWNIILSESLLMPFHFLEVALRNRLSDLLNARTNVSWPILSTGQRSWLNGVNPIPGFPAKPQWDIEKTRNKLNRRTVGRAVTADCIISQMMFGFWVKLFNHNCDQFLWTGGVRSNVFPYAPANVDRNYARQQLEDLRIMRNRIAHHEIIFTKRPVAINDLIEEICGWMDPELYHLVRTTSDFRKVNGGRPR